MFGQCQHQIDIDVGESSFQKSFPFKFSSIQVEPGFRPIGFRFFNHITEIRAVLDSQSIDVCGEANDADTAWQKAFSELYERAALVKFGSFFGAMTSNGWAAHPAKEQARVNAILELVERDAVLAHWYSKTPFIELPKEEFPLDIRAWVLTELSRSEFPNLRILLSTQGLGPSVSCFLTNAEGFGVCGHSTKESLSGAIASAIGEACRAAHAALRKEHWRDTLLLKNSQPGVVSPNAHVLYYAYHEPFQDWMFGTTQTWAQAKQQWQQFLHKCLADRQFMFRQVLQDPAVVGFATHPRAFDLAWGTVVEQSVLSHPAFERLAINPESLNIKPHIVS